MAGVAGQCLGDERLAVAEGDAGGLLGDAEGVADGVFLEGRHRPRHLRRGDRVADPPAGHPVRLAEALGDDRPRSGPGDRQRGGGDGVLAAEDDALVDAVGEQPEVVPLAEGDEVAPVVGRGGPAGRVAGAGEGEQAGVGPEGGFEAVEVEGEAVVAEREGHLDRLGAGDPDGADEVRPERRDDQGRVAGADGRLDRQVDRHHAAGGDDDVASGRRGCHGAVGPAGRWPREARDSRGWACRRCGRRRGRPWRPA